VTTAAIQEPSADAIEVVPPAPPLAPEPPVGADATEHRLIVAASQVFAEKGYDGAGVAEIARRAGLTTGAIYSRFTGKAELLCAAIQATVPDEFDLLFAEHAFDGRAKDLLNTVGAHLVSRPPEPGRSMLLEAFVAARRDPEVATQLRAQFDDRRRRFAELIDAGKAAGVIDPALDTYAIVHFAHAVGLGFLAYVAIGASQPDAANWEAVFARVVAAMDPADPTTAADLVAAHPDPIHHQQEL
jgi:TetR/AcrR family transcriptional regulator, repressor for uid operon